jgi:hypothetical protein
MVIHNYKTPARNSIYLVSILLLTVLVLGCPGNPGVSGPGKPVNGKSNNVLPIPPLGTAFDYTLSYASIEWAVQDHPRILARQEGIDTLKTQTGPGLAEDLIKSAMEQNKAIEADPKYREPLGPVACAWGFLLTGNAKYLDTVRKCIPWLTEFPPIEKSPESANFSFIQQAYALGAVYDLLYQSFTPDERAQIEKALREKVFHVLAYKVTNLDHNINFWADDPDSNYYLVWHATAGLVAVDLIGVEPDAQKLASLCWERVKRSMDVFHEEKGWREGLTYLDFCWGQSACYFLLAAERNAGLRPFDFPWFADSVAWAWWGALPNRATIADFGDNEPENYSVGSYFERVSALTGDSLYMNEAVAASRKNNLAIDLPVFRAACLARTGNGPMYNESIGNGSLYKSFPGIEWAMIRTGSDAKGPKDDNDFYCAFKSGIAGYDHNHLDQGSLILGAYSEVLLSDPGRGGPDVIRRDPVINCLFEAGLGHNTMIVGDGCYMDLQLFPDNPKYFAKPGKITSQEETPETIIFTTDNSGLYPTEPLNTFRRTFMYVKPGVIKGAPLGALIIADRLLFYSPVKHSILFHTPGEVVNPSTGRATFTSGAARLEYYGTCYGPSVDKVERQKTTMDVRDSTCYFRSTDAESRGSDWIHVLIPAPVDGPAMPEPKFGEAGFGMKISWDSYNVTLMIDPNLGWKPMDKRFLNMGKGMGKGKVIK